MKINWILLYRDVILEGSFFFHFMYMSISNSSYKFSRCGLYLYMKQNDFS